MAGVASVTMSVSVTGLGEAAVQLSNSFAATVPDAVVYQYKKLAVADTDEVLALGDVSTVEGVLIRAVDLALDVDCDYVSSFDADIPLAAGKSAYFKPEGVVRVKNGAGAEQPIYEYIVFGNRA